MHEYAWAHYDAQRLALQASLTEAERRVVDSLTSRAMGYVWGYQDALRVPRDTEQSREFAAAYGLHRARYLAGKVGQALTIQAAWERWLKGLDIEA